MPDKATLFPKNIGLALGSGSARGWAHIGVIRALAEAGISVSRVAGTSIGSLVGAAFALGRLDDLEDYARQLDLRQILSFLDVSIPRSGLIDGKKITDFFRSHVRSLAIEDLPLPYRAVATDLATGEAVILDRGDLIEAVRASISVPGVFTPVKSGAVHLIDGGLVDPVPVGVVRDMGAGFVIAVDLNADKLRRETREEAIAEDAGLEDDGPGEEVPAAAGVLAPGLAFARDMAARLNDLGAPALAQARQWLAKDPSPSIFEVLTTSINIMEARITAANLRADPPDLLIQPKLGHIRFLDFHKARETIAEGTRAAKESLAAWVG